MVISIRPGVAALPPHWMGAALAILLPTSVAFQSRMLDIDVMVRTHGVLSAPAVTALALTASTWTRKGALP